MRAKPKFLPLLVALFAGSGCAALIYEIVWFQMLQLVVGSSAISLGILLGTFMAGMCVGSVTLSRVISTRQDGREKPLGLTQGQGRDQAQHQCRLNSQI